MRQLTLPYSHGHKNEAVAKCKNFITASKFVEISSKLQCNVLQKVRAIYTANNAENSFRADKMLIIS